MKFIPPFWQIDAAIIARVFQPIANLLSGRTTPKNIGLFFAVGSICATGVMVFLSSSGEEMISSIALNFIFFIEYLIYSKQHDAVRSMTSSRTLNPLQAFFRLISLLIALLCLMQVITLEVGLVRASDVEVLRDVVFLAATMFSTAAMYFLACDQPPPRQRFSWSARVATASGRN